jgi:hypothetical protein
MSSRPSDAAHRTALQQSHLAPGAGWLGPTSSANISQPMGLPASTPQSNSTHAHSLRPNADARKAQPSNTRAAHNSAGPLSPTAGWLSPNTFTSVSAGATCSKPLDADTATNQHPMKSEPSTAASCPHMYEPGPIWPPPACMRVGQQLAAAGTTMPCVECSAAAAAAAAHLTQHGYGGRKGAGWL